MSLKEIANANCTLDVKEPTIQATLTVTSLPSTNVKADGAGVYAGGIDFVIAGATDGTCTQSAPATGTIDPTATETKANGDEVVRVDDEAQTVTVTGVLSGGGACSLAVTGYVSDAGQDKVRAE